MTNDYLKKILELARDAHESGKKLLERVDNNQFALDPDELDVIAKLAHLVGFIEALESFTENKEPKK